MILGADRSVEFANDKLFGRTVPNENGCWEWTGAHQNAGYGTLLWNHKFYAEKLEDSR